MEGGVRAAVHYVGSAGSAGSAGSKRVSQSGVSCTRNSTLPKRRPPWLRSGSGEALGQLWKAPGGLRRGLGRPLGSSGAALGGYGGAPEALAELRKVPRATSGKHWGFPIYKNSRSTAPAAVMSIETASFFTP